MAKLAVVEAARPARRRRRAARVRCSRGPWPGRSARRRCAELADRAVDRADQIGAGQRPRAGFQRAREELVEAGVGGDVGVGRLVHVHRRSGARTSGSATPSPAPPCGRRPRTAESRERTFGQQVLRQHGQAVTGHRFGRVDEGRDCIERAPCRRPGASDPACTFAVDSSGPKPDRPGHTPRSILPP